jgi:phosphopantothenoylcysteine synthetase/decarboxylase
MSTPTRPGVLYLVICGAGPAATIGTMIDLARQRQWDVHTIATPTALDFIDPSVVEEATCHTVRATYRQPGTPRQPRPAADAVIVAPATFNTINKLAAGISDNYALGILAEIIGTDTPIAILPFINTALATRGPLTAAVEKLRAEGVHILLGATGFHPHPPGHGEDRISNFPWATALDAVSAGK